MGRIILSSAEETLSFAAALAPHLKPNTVLALSGDLGAGKTTFVQGLAQGLGIDQPIVSPTFVYLNLYSAVVPLFHFDLYRLKQASDFFSLGFEEYFEKEGICAIEWPERISSFLPPSTLFLSLAVHFDGRSVTFEAFSSDLLKWLEFYGTAQ